MVPDTLYSRDQTCRACPFPSWKHFWEEQRNPFPPRLRLPSIPLRCCAESEFVGAASLAALVVAPASFEAAQTGRRRAEAAYYTR